MVYKTVLLVRDNNMSPNLCGRYKIAFFTILIFQVLIFVMSILKLTQMYRLRVRYQKEPRTFQNIRVIDIKVENISKHLSERK